MAIAGRMPMTVRATETSSRVAIISDGRNGLTKTWPRLRDQISSKKVKVTPSWPRSMISHSSTPATSAPAARTVDVAPLPDLAWLKKLAVKPQMRRFRVGQ